MEHYDLRSCFLPDLSGLHVRIYQFRALLKTNLPILNAHMDALQIDAAYVSQWFLSFFAVTCPLPMLFRIYDVIFAEGASETLMRVALSLMRKNEEKILACTEIEDVMQLLLSRGLWDCYHYNADELVNDFVSLTGVVTHESLKTLAMAYKDSKIADVSPASEVGSAASRFLGRLWANSATSTKSVNLNSSLSAPSRPASFLRRSPSKQSVASTLNSADAGSESILSDTRDSSNTDNSSIRTQSLAMNGGSKNKKDKDLHGQIEDLLTALSELQRDHALLATQLQREREEREEDRNTVRSLLDGLRKKASSDTVNTFASSESHETVKPANDTEGEEEGTVGEVMEDADGFVDEKEDEDVAGSTPDVEEATEIVESSPADELSRLLDVVEERFSAPINNRRSSMLQSRVQLREELARSKEQFTVETSRSQDLTRRLLEHEQEITNLKEAVKEGYAKIRIAHTEKQRQEQLMQDMKSQKPTKTPDGSRDTENDWPSRASSSGLRELKLGRSASTRSQTPAAPGFSKRVSSLNTVAQYFNESQYSIPITPTEGTFPKDDTNADALVLELVQAKTAEAVAKQELEEVKLKLENLRRMLGASASEPMPPPPMGRTSSGSMSKSLKVDIPTTTGTIPATAAAGGFWTPWAKRAPSAEKVPTVPERN